MSGRHSTVRPREGMSQNDAESECAQVNPVEGIGRESAAGKRKAGGGTDDSGEGKRRRERESEMPSAQGTPIVYGPGGPGPADPDTPSEEQLDEQPDGDEGIKPNILSGPVQPTVAERAIRRCTHIPYRSCCKACVLGQCLDEASRSIPRPEDADEYCRIAFEYMFLTQNIRIILEEEQVQAEGEADEARRRKVLTTLVIKDCNGDAILNYLARAKGLLRDPWIVQQMMEDLDTLGLNGHQLAVKCDQEAAVEDAQREIVRRRSADGGRKTAAENSRLGGSDSNGRMERAVGESAAMIRTLRASVEENVGEDVDIEHPVVPWLIGYAGEVITRFRVRRDGGQRFES